MGPRSRGEGYVCPSQPLGNEETTCEGCNANPNCSGWCDGDVEMFYSSLDPTKRTGFCASKEQGNSQIYRANCHFRTSDSTCHKRCTIDGVGSGHCKPSTSCSGDYFHSSQQGCTNQPSGVRCCIDRNNRKRDVSYVE